MHCAPSPRKIRHYQAPALPLSNLLKLYSDQLLRAEKRAAAAAVVLAAIRLGETREATIHHDYITLV